MFWNTFGVIAGGSLVVPGIWLWAIIDASLKKSNGTSSMNRPVKCTFR
jgi:hypothetical protein